MKAFSHFVPQSPTKYLSQYKPYSPLTKSMITQSITRSLTETAVVDDSVELVPQDVLVEVGEFFRFDALILRHPGLGGANEPIGLFGALATAGPGAHTRRQRRPRRQRVRDRTVEEGRRLWLLLLRHFARAFEKGEEFFEFFFLDGVF